MKKLFCLFPLLVVFLSLQGQERPLKLRPDAFPPVKDQSDPKALIMASTVDEMAGWDRYPTYQTYLNMMQQWAQKYPSLCHLDTIGTSVRGRLILSMYITGSEDNDLYRPEFFYSSTMHGDEVTGYVMMLRLIDTLLKGYGTNMQYTQLLNTTRISINPLANPDGTYSGGDNTVRYAMRYNARFVDLNRNYPDPFGTPPMDDEQEENTAMIAYVSAHHFQMSANLHGGSEVINYPWDSFTSSENPHPESEWWQAVGKRFVDTLRTYSNSHFRDVNNAGVIAGGDWYVISNGRQDYMNHYHNCRELTMEISTDKKLSSDQLPEYWRFLQHSLVNYIAEIHTFASGTTAVDPEPQAVGLVVYPNPTHDRLFLTEPAVDDLFVFDCRGQRLLCFPQGCSVLDISSLQQGVYILRCGTHVVKVVKR